jgi:hypothetical protein
MLTFAGASFKVWAHSGKLFAPNGPVWSWRAFAFRHLDHHRFRRGGLVFLFLVTRSAVATSRKELNVIPGARGCSILIPQLALPPHIRDKNRMR